MAQLDAAGQVTARFVFETKAHVPDYMVKSGITYRILFDHSGKGKSIQIVSLRLSSTKASAPSPT